MELLDGSKVELFPNKVDENLQVHHLPAHVWKFRCLTSSLPVLSLNRRKLALIEPPSRVLRKGRYLSTKLSCTGTLRCQITRAGQPDHLAYSYFPFTQRAEIASMQVHIGFFAVLLVRCRAADHCTFCSSPDDLHLRWPDDPTKRPALASYCTK